MKKPFPTVEVTLDKIVGGGQTLGLLPNGKKIFVWGGLPRERVLVQITKQRSNMAEGFVTKVIEPSSDRVEPVDENSFLSTSPWQIISPEVEKEYKIQLIREAFVLHHIKLSDKIDLYSNGRNYHYRNKVEFSWYWDKDKNQLELAFFKRGSHGKVAVDGTSLAQPALNKVAIATRNLLRNRDIGGFDLKTLLLRCDKSQNVVAQLYVKNENFPKFSDNEIRELGVKGFEVIFSNPKSPASVITKKLQIWGETTLTDEILGVPFNYSAESFFQVNLPIYEQALLDIKKWINPKLPLIDFYSGVGTIGLTIGQDKTTLIESNESAVTEMRNNINSLNKNATAILAEAEKALEYIDDKSTIILDPPRAGLNSQVTSKLLQILPPRIIYLSCNPVTQGRDISILLEKYKIIYERGYNFFPRTPHIENLVVLDRL